MLNEKVLVNLAFLRVTVAMRNWFKKVSPTLNVILEAVTWQLTMVSASVTSHTHTGPLYTQGSSMTARLSGDDTLFIPMGSHRACLHHQAESYV